MFIEFQVILDLKSKNILAVLGVSLRKTSGQAVRSRFYVLPYGTIHKELHFHPSREVSTTDTN
jgi:hypothetical protein